MSIRDMTACGLARAAGNNRCVGWPELGLQQVVDDHLRAMRYRNEPLGLADDAARRMGFRRRQRDESLRSNDRGKTAESPYSLRPRWLRIRVPRTNDGLPVVKKCDRKATGPPKIDMDKSSQMHGFR